MAALDAVAVPGLTSGAVNVPALASVGTLRFIAFFGCFAPQAYFQGAQEPGT